MAEASALPPAQKQSWGAFLKQLASLSGDLSSMTAPPFILSPVSLTEFPAYWCERPDLFVEITQGKDAEDRALKVLKWFISTLKGQYTSRNEKMGTEKKPLNPALGEEFIGVWPDLNGRGLTTLTVEQVSHHPPITAYYIENASKGIALQGHCGQRTSFSAGAIIAKQVGHATLAIKLADGSVEHHLITLPNLRVDGIFYGSPYVELTHTSYISSSSGWVSTIEYKGKGYFSGKSHSFKSTTTRGSVAHVVEGLWHETSTMTTGKANAAFFHDVRGPKEEVTVKPVEEQGEWETRRFWKLVADGIKTGDFEMASREKTKIENEQRQRRKDEVAAGTPWKLKFFVRLEDDPEYAKLGKQFNAIPETEDAYVYQKPTA